MMNREQISALMDGELDEARVQTVCQSMKDDDACACWASYHLIGDALRRETFAQGDFARRFAERLAGEPTVLAPGSHPAGERAASRAASWSAHWPDQVRARPWYYGMAAAAAVAAVGLVGWFGAQEFNLGPALTEQAAATPARTGVASIAVNAQSSAAMSRRAPSMALDPYLLVHQEFSPTTVMQGVRPYVRTVADVTATE
jgi:sigma-E factor negative regulatory protein RseA